MEGPLSVFGDRSTGEAIRSQNVMVAASIANIVKSSLGPVGLDKMLVDDIGDVTITNDGATILKLLEVEHPAAKVLCELADLHVHLHQLFYVGQMISCVMKWSALYMMLFVW
uniref:T-complex protein 1 subunit alpha n=1 Tax=Sciurus vulgaris TaxID=55149 RepID=A0A8D2JN69_SCIVU